MGLLYLRTYPDPVLRTPAEPVTVFDDRLEDLIAELTLRMRVHHGVGLAAPQLGVASRVIVFLDADGRPQHLVNPVLVSRSAELAVAEEGCLSLPGLFAQLPRSTGVSAVGQRADGTTARFDASGFVARCVQHEIDHLDGVLFVDHLPPAERDRLLAALVEQAGPDALPRTATSPRHHR